jgi:hypothetical protein
MIEDPTIRCTCDKCGDVIEVEPEFGYQDYSGNNGFYDCSNDAIEAKLRDDFQWQCEDGKHYCCDCVDSAEDEE